MKLADFELDQTAMDDGVPHADPFVGTARFWIRSTGSTAYKAAAAEAYARLADADAKDAEANTRANELLLEAEAVGLLARWEGVELDDGSTHNGYDRAIAVRLLRIPSFRKWVRGIAEREAEFRARRVRDAAAAVGNG